MCKNFLFKNVFIQFFKGDFEENLIKSHPNFFSSFLDLFTFTLESEGVNEWVHFH